MHKLRVLRNFILERLRERSTWVAAGFVFSALGMKFAAELDWDKASSLGLVLASIIQMVWPDTE